MVSTKGELYETELMHVASSSTKTVQIKIKIKCLFPYTSCRTLAIDEGMKLYEKMKHSFRGSGMETIFLMFQKSIGEYYREIHPEGDTCHAGLTVDQLTMKDWMLCFLDKQYDDVCWVPSMFIPACGQVS